MIMRLRVAWRAAAFAVWFCVGPLFNTAAQDCASAEACLAKSFERDWSQYHDLIDQTWAQRRQMAELLRTAQSTGQTGLIPMIKAEQEKIEASWRVARAIAVALSDPALRAQLATQHAEAEAIRDTARERLAKETDLYRRLLNSTIGPQRQGVQRDIKGYEQEARELRKQFMRDGFMTSVSLGNETAKATLMGWIKLSDVMTAHGVEGAKQVAATIPYVRSLNMLRSTQNAAYRDVQSGMTIEQARRQHKDFAAMAETTKTVGVTILRTADLIAAMPAGPIRDQLMSQVFGVWAAKASLSLNVISLGIDTWLTIKALDRLEAAEQRQQKVELDDAFWRKRVEVAGRVVRDATAREQRAAQTLEQQARVQALFARIRQEGD